MGTGSSKKKNSKTILVIMKLIMKYKNIYPILRNIVTIE